MGQTTLHTHSMRRHGTVAVMVLVVLTVLAGFVALTVDVGAMYNIRGDLQQAADAAALAGATSLTTDEMMGIRFGNPEDDDILEDINERVQYASLRNMTLGVPSIVTMGSDIVAGWIDLSASTSPVNDTVALSQLNAVQAMVRCDDETPNGSVALSFARLLGFNQSNIAATATAAFDDRFVGFAPSSVPNPFVPFTIHEDVYNGGGPDVYDYDDDLDMVHFDSDGIPEINLYPHAEIGNGNFGLLSIPAGNNGASAISDQIENGISPEDLEAEFGSAALDFFDGSGNPITYSVSGAPGLKNSLKDAIASRVGEVIAVLLHDANSGTGANKVFHVTGMRFVRVMAVDMQGGDKSIWVQPATFTSPGVQVGPNAPSSGGSAGQLVLVR